MRVPRLLPALLAALLLAGGALATDGTLPPPPPPAATVAAPALSSALGSLLLLADEAARRVLQAVQKTAASLTASADSKAPWWVLRGCACSRCRVRIANTAATQGRTAGGTGASSD